MGLLVLGLFGDHLHLAGGVYCRIFNNKLDADVKYSRMKPTPRSQRVPTFPQYELEILQHAIVVDSQDKIVRTGQDSWDIF
jgi:hypothetical protein